MIKNLVISGGGFNAVVFLGCYKYLEEINALEGVHTLIGSSAGSVICFSIALGLSFTDIYNIFLARLIIDEKATDDPPSYDDVPIDPFQVFESYGLSSGEKMTVLFQYILDYKLHVQDITFMEFAKLTGRNLVICVTNLTQQTTEYCSLETTPQMSIIIALRMSSSVPFLLTPVKYNDQVYVDGCLYNHLPVDYLMDEIFRDKNTLGLLIEPHKPIITHFGSYMQALLFSTWNQLNLQRRKYAAIPSICNIIIPIDKSVTSNIEDIMQMKIPLSKLDSYIELGYKRIREYVLETKL